MDCVVYQVKKGDSLWSISRDFYGAGCYWESIYADNIYNIGINPNIIREDMLLDIKRRPLSTMKIIKRQLNYMQSYEEPHIQRLAWRLEDRYWEMIKVRFVALLFVAVCFYGVFEVCTTLR